MNNDFLGMLVLDFSTHANVQGITDFINTVTSAWDHTKLIDLFNTDFKDTQLSPDKLINGLTIIASTQEPLYNEIPSKSGTLFLWEKTPQDQDILNKYLNVNVTQNKKFKNYADRVKHHLTDTLTPPYAGMLITASRRSSITLINHSMNLYFSVITLFDCTLLLWTTRFDVISILLKAIPDSHPMAYLKTNVWVNHITPLHPLYFTEDQDKRTLIIHPLYLLTRYRTWGKSHNFNQLILLNLIEKYLTRIAI